MKKITTFLAVLTVGLTAFAASGERWRQAVTVGAGGAQVKDSENLGMVFGGPRVDFAYTLQHDFGPIVFDYQTDMSVAGVFARGMTGYAIGFSPVSVGVGHSWLNQPHHRLSAGLATGLRYHWQMYPDLHNSQLFSVCEIPLELTIAYTFIYKRNSFSLNLANSIFGLTGGHHNPDPYFYSLSFSEFAFKPFSNLKFSSFGSYDHTHATATWSPADLQNHSFGFSLDYLSVGAAGRSFKSLTYSLIWQKRF